PVQARLTGGRPTRTQYQYALEDADVTVLRTWAPKMVEAMKKLPELKDVATDLQIAGRQMDVTLDRDMASQLGILPQNIDDTLYDAFGQRQVPTNPPQPNEARVERDRNPALAGSPDAIEMLCVRSRSGAVVPMRMLSKPPPSMTALSPPPQSQSPAVTLSFNLAPGVSLGQ